MQNSFTVHCIDWKAGAPLLQEVRAADRKQILGSFADSRLDEKDNQCRHALALSKGGRAIGCARITREGMIEKIVVLPHEQQGKIVEAMIEVLNDYHSQIKTDAQPAPELTHVSRPANLRI